MRNNPLFETIHWVSSSISKFSLIVNLNQKQSFGFFPQQLFDVELDLLLLCGNVAAVEVLRFKKLNR